MDVTVLEDPETASVSVRLLKNFIGLRALG
jgi:hypothetical protein